MSRSNSPRKRPHKGQVPTLAGLLAVRSPSNVAQEVLGDAQLSKRLGISVKRTITIGGLVLDQASFINTVKNISKGKRQVSTNTSEGQKLLCSAERAANGSFFLRAGSALIPNLEADLLSTKRESRLGSLERICQAHLLNSESVKSWTDIILQRPLTADEFVDLNQEATITPELYAERLQGAASLSIDILIPERFRYFQTLVPIPHAEEQFREYLQGRLASERQDMVKRNPMIAGPRIALTAISQPLIPVDTSGLVELRILDGLVQRADPFSLITVFEIAARNFKTRPELVEIGGVALEKLVANAAIAKERAELYAASIVITYAGLRRHSSARAAPLYWRRLATFAHAGVITNALFRKVDAKAFHDWALKNFGALFYWGTTSDRRIAPRWHQNWVGPMGLHAEFVGRVSIALNSIPLVEQPAKWRELITTAVNLLTEKNVSPQMYFSGPLEDFSSSPQPAEPAIFAAALEGLAAKKPLNEVAGLAVLAYTSKLEDEHIRQFEQSLLNTSMPESAEEFEVFLGALGLAAYVAGVYRSEAIAVITADRACSFFAHKQSEVESVASIIVEAANAFDAKEANYTWLSSYLFRLAHLCASKEQAEMLSLIITDLCDHDCQYRPYLSRALAVAELLRNKTT